MRWCILFVAAALALCWLQWHLTAPVHYLPASATSVRAWQAILAEAEADAPATTAPAVAVPAAKVASPGESESCCECP
jgi:hypothetical protein